MSLSGALAPALACPRCDRTPLAATSAGWHCAGCRVDFPRLAGIPWLFAEPDAAHAEWRARLHFALRRLARERTQLTAAAERADLRPLTRDRLVRLATATAAHERELAALLAPLEVDRLTASLASHLALRTRPPSDQGLTTYYANVHRDWAWGDEENAASLAIVAAALGDSAPGRTLVLGAGAGRLAYDLHQSTVADCTVALDFNPLLLLVADRMARGESLELHEFPLAPLDLEHCAVRRTLSAPAPARDGLQCVLADVHRPPFARGSFDTIVTPWLVDVLPEPFGDQCARINWLLAEKGRWINFGSLAFHGQDPVERLSREECLETVARHGFAEPLVAESTIPYMCSPASRHARRERVVSFAATKRRDTKRPERHVALPDWLVLGKDPVPLLDAFRLQASTTRIHAFIMGLIDGRRSIADMAQVLAEQRLMPREEAEPAIRGFLIQMYEDGRRGGRF